MVNYKFTNISVSVAVLFIILQVANTSVLISYEDFLQCIEDSVTSDVAGLQVSKLPHEILHYMEELYENKILKDFATTTKDDLTKILTNDMKSRENYYEKNKKIFESFLLKALEKDMKNYPDENSGINAMDISFLSLMTMATVDEIIEDTIVNKKAPLDESSKVFTLKDAFRTVFFYCKYPKEIARFLTEKMRVEVKEWLDSRPTWGSWGFDDEDAKIEL